MMSILVTGINGFVGSYLSMVLSDNGYSVKGTVRSHEKAASLPSTQKISLINNIGPETDWREALKGIDVIIHLAARVHIMRETSDNPLQDFRHVNAEGTRHLAQQAAEAGVKRVIFLSTIKVNGEKTITKPFTESDAPAPDDQYSISKWEAEQSLSGIANKSGLEFVIIRPPLVYGAGVKGNFQNLMKLTRKGIPLPLAGIDNKRSLVYMGNLVDAILKCIEHPSAANKTFLISDGEDLSTSELIRKLASTFDKPARLFYFPSAMLRLAGAIVNRKNMVSRLTNSLTVDSSKIRGELDWTPPFTVNQGLKETVEWFKNNEPV